MHLSPNRTWILTRYDDVDALNHDRRLGRDLRAWGPYRTFRPYIADSALEHSVERWVLNLDPPDHSRIRKSASRHFTAGAMGRFAEPIRSITEQLLDELDGLDEFDFIESFAHPQARRVIGALLSLPPDDLELLDGWGRSIAVVLEPAFGLQEKLAANEAAAEMTEYLQRFVRDGGLASSGELASKIGAIHAEGGLTEDEVVALYVSLVVTAVAANIVGNGMLHLLRHPRNLLWLRRNLSAMPRAVDELLRYDGRGINARVAHEDVELRGKRIRTGQLVFCMLGAANRDPQVFPEPDRLVLTRDPNPHVTFGGGIHHCLGAALTGVQARVGFTRILERWPSIELDEAGVKWNDYSAIRAVERLPVRMGGSGGA
ncbi:MAG: cytochrome P450 [Actinomycetota bacterium]|nr:cytochrome P450 [Actinomycetota bacterium]